MSVHAQIGTSSWDRMVWNWSTSSRFETQDIGSCASEQRAAQADTRNRCAGRVHESAGANMRSCRTNVLA